MESTAPDCLVSLSLASGCFLANFTSFNEKRKDMRFKVGGRLKSLPENNSRQIISLSNYLSIRMK